MRGPLHGRPGCIHCGWHAQVHCRCLPPPDWAPPIAPRQRHAALVGALPLAVPSKSRRARASLLHLRCPNAATGALHCWEPPSATRLGLPPSAQRKGLTVSWATPTLIPLTQSSRHGSAQTGCDWRASPHLLGRPGGSSSTPPSSLRGRQFDNARPSLGRVCFCKDAPKNPVKSTRQER